MLSKALKDQPAKFYWIEGTRNNLPKIIPHIDGYPSLFFYPMKEKDSPIKVGSYDSMETLLTVFNELNHHDQVYYIPDDFDQKAANETIRLLRR